MLFGVVVLFAQEPIPRDELGISTLESLNELVDKTLKNHEKLVAEQGSEHPAVKRSERELDSLENMRDQQLKKMPSWARRNIAAMDDEQLRYMVGVLVERVIRLEDEVQKLRNPEVRTELLSDRLQ